MKKVLSLMLLSLLTVSFPAVNYAQDAAPAAAAPQASGDPAKIADIRKLISLTGGDKVGEQMIDQMIKSFSAYNPNIPAEFWNEFKKNIDLNKINEMNIPVYDKYLSADEIKETIKFYESAVGRKLIEVLPKILEETYTSGEQWGYEVGTKLQNMLLEKGYLKTDNAAGGAAQAAPAAAAPAAEPAK
ncbi:MAG: DUF2059 domain-containing protein [Candidatus Omnitrophica bacterium]|nr:DUF2059 domain-containing protein [Candidatus Omnitrophota bacterium]